MFKKNEDHHLNPTCLVLAVSLDSTSFVSVNLADTLFSELFRSVKAYFLFWSFSCSWSSFIRLSRLIRSARDSFSSARIVTLSRLIWSNFDNKKKSNIYLLIQKINRINRSFTCDSSLLSALDDWDEFRWCFSKFSWALDNSTVLPIKFSSTSLFCRLSSEISFRSRSRSRWWFSFLSDDSFIDFFSNPEK